MRTRRGEHALALPCPVSEAEALETAGTVGTGMGQMWGSRACVPTAPAVQSCESPTRPRLHRDTGGTSLVRHGEGGRGWGAGAPTTLGTPPALRGLPEP